LRAYWDAVGVRTRDITAGLPDETFDKLVGGRYAPRLDPAGAQWVTEYLSGRQRHWTVRTPAYDILSRLLSTRSELSQIIVSLKYGQG
jgi:hypothetical protein